MRTVGAAAMLICGCTNQAPTPRTDAPSASAQPLVFVGDLAPVRSAAQALDDGADPWPDATGLWIGNLEGALDLERPCARPDGLCMPIAARHLDRLAAGPFVALSTANNHADDQGQPHATADALSARGLTALTEHGGPHLIESPWGDSLGVVTLSLVGRPLGEIQLAVEAALLQVGLAAARSPWVAVMPHWGPEDTDIVDDGQRALAARLRAWGANLIIGSHSHQAGPTACHGDAATWYSLGDHLFSRTRSYARTGLRVACTPTPRGDLRCDTSLTRTALGTGIAAPIDGDIAPCDIRRPPTPDSRWLTHPGAADLRFVQAFPAAGPDAFFALHYAFSTFDDATALRPYVFEMTPGGVHEIWRGTALSRPLVAAALVPASDGGQRLCALHRTDGFLNPQPETLDRTRKVYRWTGFGFRGDADPVAIDACNQR